MENINLPNQTVNRPETSTDYLGNLLNNDADSPQAAPLYLKKLTKGKCKPIDVESMVDKSKLRDVVLIDDRSESVDKALLLIDTVKIRTPYHFRDGKFRGVLLWSGREEKSGFIFHEYSREFCLTNKAIIKVTYYPTLNDGQSYLALEFSVQKVVIGNNYQKIKDNINLSEILCYELSKVFQILNIDTPVNLYDFFISRFDVARNFDVGTKLHLYQKYLNDVVYPRRMRQLNANTDSVKSKEGNNGASFITKSIRTCLYDKVKEAQLTIDRTILRLEVSFRATDVIKDVFGRTKPMVGNLTYDFCKQILQNELEALGLNNPIQSLGSVFEKLREKFPDNRKFQTLFAHISLEKQFPGLSSKDLSEKVGVSKKTINDHRRMLKEAGISFYTDKEIVLPPLNADDPIPDVIIPNSDGIDMRSTSVEKECNTWERLSFSVQLHRIAGSEPNDDMVLYRGIYYPKWAAERERELDELDNSSRVKNIKRQSYMF